MILQYLSNITRKAAGLSAFFHPYLCGRIAAEWLIYMTIQQIISRLEAWHAPLDTPLSTCDTVKCGDAAQECTGIAVTCYVSMNVIRQAKEQGINFIICHEPTFYSDAEATAEWLEGNDIFETKRRALEDANIVVWRDHDHIHGPGGLDATVHEVPDYIYCGIMKELGWEEYAYGEETKPLWFKLPETTVKELAQELLVKLNLTGLRVVGSVDAKVSTVHICEHVFGDHRDGFAIQRAEKADVLIPLEIVDWTLSEYVRDAADQGCAKAILEMGHFNFEELGMKYMVQWLPEVIDHALPITYIQSGDSFRYILRNH